MGRVTCANVLSDLYAMGIVDCDNMLMLLGVAVELSEKERDIIISMFIRGFKVCIVFFGDARVLLSADLF
ncbi:hypothetical protein TELCIR_12285 [Teladorsagia circumcincta]|uniref:PurM-like N-terminal domain-containing protein n=1 Tax=Teladorsagia circumcincta TaxID=45464 RepID=A0A2G9U713_TELCI|nr:hypothetical protein TELCIR_12285 [Teladorsagia circumcincta]